MSKTSLVSIIMGSLTDFDIVKFGVEILKDFGISYDVNILSAHRTPDALDHHIQSTSAKVFIAAAGGAAHLPGVIASKTCLPVIGIPINSTPMNGVDSLYSIVQMPKGIPVACVSIGKPGAINAALLAVQILSTEDSTLIKKMQAYRDKNKKKILEQNQKLEV